jgi:poly(3-hydroxybutyrate) depolymerase
MLGSHRLPFERLRPGCPVLLEARFPGFWASGKARFECSRPIWRAKDEIIDAVATITDLVDALSQATAADKARIYAGLGPH